MLENLKNALKNTVIYSIGNLSSKLLGLIGALVLELGAIHIL